MFLFIGHQSSRTSFATHRNPHRFYENPYDESSEGSYVYYDDDDDDGDDDDDDYGTGYCTENEYCNTFDYYDSYEY